MIVLEMHSSGALVPDRRGAGWPLGAARDEEDEERSSSVLSTHDERPLPVPAPGPPGCPADPGLCPQRLDQRSSGEFGRFLVVVPPPSSSLVATRLDHSLPRGSLHQQCSDERSQQHLVRTELAQLTPLPPSPLPSASSPLANPLATFSPPRSCLSDLCRGPPRRHCCSKQSAAARIASSNRTAVALSLVSAGTFAWYSALFGNPLVPEAKAEGAADHGLHPAAYPWAHNGPFETFDHSS